MSAAQRYRVVPTEDGCWVVAATRPGGELLALAEFGSEAAAHGYAADLNARGNVTGTSAPGIAPRSLGLDAWADLYHRPIPRGMYGPQHGDHA